MQTVDSYIRKYNYIQDWYHTQNELAANLFQAAYPITYFSIDWKQSIVEDSELDALSYEKFGLGKLSGMKWKMIKMLPVYFTEGMSVNNIADERGMTMVDTMHTSIVIPTAYGIDPMEWDFIQFNQDFMFNGTKPGPLFVVKNTEQTNYGDNSYLKISIKAIDNNARYRLEDQISSHHMFLEFTKQIHDDNTASILIYLQTLMSSMCTSMNLGYHKSGMYVVPK